MVNGLHLYSIFIQSTVQFMPLIQPFTQHTYTPTAIGCHARCQPAHQEQLGVRCLAQGHTQGGIEPATLRLPDDSSYILSHLALREMALPMLCIASCVGYICLLHTKL